ncbi:MAG: sulfurtransferase complex subunit TusD [Pseudohongiellaceae bacterium]
MTDFAIVIHGAPCSSESAHTAYRFTRAALENGHRIHRLFFFGDGVYNLNRLAVAAQDETNLPAQWNELILKHKLDAVVCVSSAVRRGIVDTQEAERHELGAASAYPSAEIAGLGQLVDAALHADRTINFG